MDNINAQFVFIGRNRAGDGMILWLDEDGNLGTNQEEVSPEEVTDTKTAFIALVSDAVRNGVPVANRPGGF